MQSIIDSYEDHEKILSDELEWDAINRNFFFYRLGMFVGVELDGYIHT